MQGFCMNNDPVIYAGKKRLGAMTLPAFLLFLDTSSVCLLKKIQESLGMPGKMNLITEFSVFSACDATVF